MSSPAVREAFRTAWPQFAPGIPYVDAINRPPGPLPAVFGSMLFAVESRRDVTMGESPWVDEDGTVVVSFFTPSGEGDTAAIAAASAAAVWLQNRTFSLDLCVTALVGPNDSVPEGEGEFFEAQVSASYQWQAREIRT
jgi:hypothetical protein